MIFLNLRLMDDPDNEELHQLETSPTRQRVNSGEFHRFTRWRVGLVDADRKDGQALRLPGLECQAESLTDVSLFLAELTMGRPGGR